MVRLPAVALCCLSVALLPACGDDDDGDGGVEAPPPGEAAVLEVIDTGSEPLQVMELNPKAGDQGSVLITLEQSVTGVPALPAIEMTIDTEVTEVTDERITTEFEYSDTGVAQGSGDPSVVGQIESALATFRGTRGTIVTSPTGQFIEGGFDTPAGLDPAIASVFDQMEGQLRSMTVPFPDEPVGEGAIWSGAVGLELQGVTSATETTYELEEFDGDSYTLSSEVEQTLSGGGITEGNQSGSGTIEGSLTEIFPTSGTSTTGGTIVAEALGTDGETTEVEQELELTVTLEQIE
jgi:hypothetical protein